MKKIILFFLGGMLLLVSSSCTKNNGEEIQRKKAEEFRASVQGKQYKLVDFYSDLPIDYIETDTEIKQETDLRPYIKRYLLDDENNFNTDGSLTINQKADRIPGDEPLILNRKYAVRWSATDALIDFVDYYYIPLTYKLSEYSPTTFTIYLNWYKGNAKIYSRYELVP